MIAAGIGCRRGADVRDILDVLHQAAESAGVDPAAVACLSVPDFKQDEPGLHKAASELAIPLLFVPRGVIEEFQSLTHTYSEKVMAAIGLANVAEAAALAGVGPGAELMAPRIASPVATCALAIRSSRQKPLEPLHEDQTVA